MDRSDKDNEVNSETRRTEEILNSMEPEEQSCNRMQEYCAGGQAERNEVNETLDSDSNEIGSAEKNPSNIQCQSNKKQVIVQHKKKHGTKPMKAELLRLMRNKFRKCIK
jgi:hypothetical protein